MLTDHLKERYVNPYTDFGFKVLFGTPMNKDLLISFLNALLHDRQQITDITYLNAEHLGVSEPDRKAIFDVYCENDKGEKFIVEMQKANQQFFKDRSVFYSTFPIREQAKRGDWDFELKAVYTIGILNFVFDEDAGSDEYYHHEVKLMDVDSKEVFFDKLTFIYLEMPKFRKQESELHTLFDKWMFVLRNLSSLLERPTALQERVFEKLFTAAEISCFTPHQLDEYEESLKVFRDLNNVIKTAKWEGWEEGREEGLKEGLTKGQEQGREEGLKEGLKEGENKGRNKERLQMAAGMKQKGIPSEVIAELTGFSLEEIDNLSEK